MSRSFGCPRCSAVISVPTDESAPQYLETSGWARFARVPGQKAQIRLADGRTATVQADSFEVDSGSWHCGISHALETIGHLRRAGVDHSYDPGRDGGARLRWAEEPAPKKPETIACACGSTIDVAPGQDKAATLSAHGWTTQFCSRRCAALAGARAAEPAVAPVLEIGDVTVRGRLAAGRAAAPAAATKKVAR